MKSFKNLEKIADIIYFPNRDLRNYSSIKLRAYGDLFIVSSVVALQFLLKDLYRRRRSFRMIGMGSNQIFLEKSSLVYIKLTLPFRRTYLAQPRTLYHLPASVMLRSLSLHAVKFGIKGWEVLTGIPATLGGAVFMNAGTALGEISRLVEGVQVIDRHGEKREVKVDKGAFSYRKNHFLEEGDCIVEVTLRTFGRDKAISSIIKNYLQFRERTQPLKKATVGCIFKNDLHLKAGQAIDRLGLKGLRVEGLTISEIHANFIEHHGGSNYGQMIRLIDIIDRELYLQYGIKFEKEIQYDKDFLHSDIE